MQGAVRTYASGKKLIERNWSFTCINFFEAVAIGLIMPHCMLTVLPKSWHKPF